MKISNNITKTYSNLITTAPRAIKKQFVGVEDNASNTDGQPALASSRPKRVYLQTEDMLFSGGNGTGLSYHIKYAEGSTEENPIVVANGIDENGAEFEQIIKINDINPQNATIIEMRALEAYFDVDKKGGLTSLPLSTGNLGLHDRKNFIDIFRKEISDMYLLRQNQVAQFYSQNMNKYLDLLR